MAEANAKLTDAQKLAKAKDRVAKGMGESAKEIARLTKRIEDAKNQAPKKEKKEPVAA
jgi:signal recognition particle GTPase